MPRTLSDDQLAYKLEQNQVDRTILDEAARRIRECDLRQLLYTNSIVEAVHQSPLIDLHQAEVIEQVVMAVKPSRRRQSSSRLSTLAARILNGADYSHADVRSLAASVMSQDETPGQ